MIETLVVDASATRADGLTNLAGNTRQGSLRTVWSTRLSPKTTAYAGARYQRLRSDITSNFSERAVFVGVAHVFR